MNIFQNTFRVLHNPEMLRLYILWLTQRKPSLTVMKRKFFGFPTFSDYWSIYTDMPSSAEVMFVKNSIGEGGVAFDVGANIGLYSAIIASIEPNMYVYAFEPVEHTFNLLRENLADLANVLPCRMAVSDHSGALFVTNTKAGFRSNHLCQERIGKDVEKICSVTIDEFADMRGVKSIALLKIDVEGSEPRVLRGLRSTKTHNILIEICQNNLEAMGSSMEELYEEIRSKDLYPYMIENDGTTKQRMTMLDLRSVDLMNVALR